MKVISVTLFTIQHTSGSKKSLKCTSKHFDAKDTERIVIILNKADWKTLFLPKIVKVFQLHRFLLENIDLLKK